MLLSLFGDIKGAMDIWPGDLWGGLVFFSTAERVFLVPEQRRTAKKNLI